jgi:hypothetical protein
MLFKFANNRRCRLKTGNNIKYSYIDFDAIIAGGPLFTGSPISSTLIAFIATKLQYP